MTPADLDRLEALYEKAMPGEWETRGAVVITGDGGFDLYNLPNGFHRAALIAALHNAFPALLEAARKGAEQRWIPVEERLPEKYQPVALLSVERFESCHFDRNIQAAGYLDNMASHRPYWSIRGERATVLEAFTHWMPLPASPQKEEGNG